MSKLPDFIKVGVDEIDVWAVDLSAVCHRLNTSSWTEEAGPVEITDAEMIALLEAAVKRGADEQDARWLGAMLAEVPNEQAGILPGLRLAYAHLLAISPRSPGDECCESIHTVAIAYSRAIRAG